MCSIVLHHVPNCPCIMERCVRKTWEVARRGAQTKGRSLPPWSFCTMQLTVYSHNMLDCTASIGWITMATLIPTASNVALVTGLSQKKDMPLLHLKERNTHLWAATKTILMQQIPVMIRVIESAHAAPLQKKFHSTLTVLVRPNNLAEDTKPRLRALPHFYHSSTLDPVPVTSRTHWSKWRHGDVYAGGCESSGA